MRSCASPPSQPTLPSARQRRSRATSPPRRDGRLRRCGRWRRVWASYAVTPLRSYAGKLRTANALARSYQPLYARLLDRHAEAVGELHLGLPLEHLARERDVGLAHLGVVLGQRLEHDLRA